MTLLGEPRLSPRVPASSPGSPLVGPRSGGALEQVVDRADGPVGYLPDLPEPLGDLRVGLYRLGCGGLVRVFVDGQTRPGRSAVAVVGVAVVGVDVHGGAPTERGSGLRSAVTSKRRRGGEDAHLAGHLPLQDIRRSAL